MSAQQGFAVWVTGLPASGKSSLVKELATMLTARGVPLVVLESDAMRTILTPEPAYTAEERDLFYRSLALIGELITRNGVNVVFDATANRRSYRDHARTRISRFVEVYVSCPLEICIQRDPKGIYRAAMSGDAGSVPGVQAEYEPPLRPELTVDCRIPPEAGAIAIMDKLGLLRYV